MAFADRDKYLILLSQIGQRGVFAFWIVLLSLFINNFVNYGAKAAEISLIQLSAEEKAWLENNPEITFYVLDDVPPDSFQSGNQMVGVVPDLLALFEEKIGNKVVIKPVEYDKISELATSEKPLVIGMSSAGSIDLFQGYENSADVFTSYFSLFTLNEPEEPKDFDNLQGEKIAFFDHITHPVLEKLRKNNQAYEFPKFEMLVGALLSGEVDYFVDYRELSHYLLRRSTAQDVFEVHTFKDADQGVFVVREDEPVFKSILNKFILDVRTNELPLLMKRWYKGSANYSRLNLTEVEKEWIRKNPKITFGFTADFPPALIQDEAGELSGFLIDIYRELSERSGLQIDIEVIDWRKAAELVENNTIDGLLGVSEAFPLSDSLTRLESLAVIMPTWYGRIDDIYPLDDPSTLEGKRIATVTDLRLVNPIIEQLKDKNIFVPVDSTLDGMKLLLEKRVDYFLGSNMENYWSAKFPNFGLEVKHLVFTEASDIFGIVNTGQPELKSILDKAIKEMGQSAIDQIVYKWTLLNLKSDSLELTNEELTWIEEHPEINIAMAAFPPYIIEEPNGELSGIIIEYFDRLNKILGTQIDIIPGTVPVTLNRIRNREVDGMAALIADKAKEMGLLATNGHFVTNVEVFGLREDARKIESPSDLEGTKVAYHKEFLITRPWVEKYILKENIIPVDTSEEGFQKLVSGEIDYYVGIPAESYFLAELALSNVISKYSDLSSANTTVVGVRNDWPQLVNILNKGISRISDAEKNRIKAQWFGSSEDKFALTLYERVWLSSLSKLKLASSSAWEPFDYLDETQNLTGLAKDFLAVIQENIKLDYESVDVAGWQNALERLQTGEVDIIPGLPVEGRQNRNVLYTDPIFRVPQVLVVLDTAPFVIGLEDFQNKVVIVAKDSASHLTMLTSYPDWKLLVVDDLKTAMQRLDSGEGDVLFTNNVAYNFWQRKLKVDNIKIAATTNYSYDFSFAVKNELSPLVPILNKILGALSEREKSLIIEKWVNQQSIETFDWSTFIFWTTITAIVIIVIFSVIVAWNRRLQLEVATRMQAEIKAHQAEQQAIDANQAKSAFLANMSHEIRTPMNAILGYVQLLQNDYSLQGEHRRLVGTINQSGKHLLALINDILDMSKIEAGKMDLSERTFNLYTQLGDIEEMLRYRAEEKGLHLQFSKAENLPEYVYADQAKFSQVIINLLGNSIKFTERGSINLRAELIEESDSSVKIQLIVQDTGVGIEPARRAAIFEPFSQAEQGQLVGGTGLGLPISREIARLMGGDIELVESDGPGATFAITLELKKSEKRKANQAEGLPGKPIRLAKHVGSPTILVVDDIVTNRDLLKYGLSKFGFSVVLAENGIKGIQAFENHRPEAILMDIVMPEMGGIEASQKIRELAGNKCPKLIALTAGAIEAQDKDSQQLDFDATLFKPVNLKELLSTLARLCGYELEYDDTPIDSNTSGASLGLKREDFNDLPGETRQEIAEALRLGKIADLRAQTQAVTNWNQEKGEVFAELVSSFQLNQLKMLFLSESQEN